ncbi:MAG: trypsin-like peptidase domain-containing protein [Planctomycetota bacterium]
MSDSDQSRDDENGNAPPAASARWSIPIEVTVRVGNSAATNDIAQQGPVENAARPLPTHSPPTQLPPAQAPSEGVHPSVASTRTPSTQRAPAAVPATTDATQQVNATHGPDGQAALSEVGLTGPSSLADEPRSLRPSRRKTRWNVAQLVTQAIWPHCDETALRATVWYVQARFPGGIKEGSAVMIRIGHQRQPQAQNVLLTCRHVIYNEEDETLAEEIRCWPNGSGYNPDSDDRRRRWTAKPFLLPSNAGSFLSEGSKDWVLLSVQRDGDDVDQEAYAPGFDQPRWTRIQPLNPYRLIGFPFGRRLMNRNVANAEVSRDFRLSSTDPRTGTIAITAGEKTGGGFSGGPYFDRDGRVVAIHRGLDGTIVGIHPAGIENELEKHDWLVTRVRPQHLWVWGIRVILMLLLCTGVFASWRAAQPGEQTLHAIEGLTTKHFLGPSRAYTVISQDKGEHASGRIFEYQAAALGDIGSALTVEDRLTYRRQVLGFPSPESPLEVIVHRHRTFGTVDEFCDEFLKFEEPGKQAWMNEATRPVFSFAFSTPAKEAKSNERRFSTEMNSEAIWVIYDKNSELNIEAKFSLGNDSPLKSGQQKFGFSQSMSLDRFELVGYSFSQQGPPNFNGGPREGPKISLEFESASKRYSISSQ